MHHEIVALERKHQPLPPAFDFPPPATYTLTTYDYTLPADLHARIANATIIIVTTIPITAETLHENVTPNLQLVVVMATGTDPVDLEACRRRRIRVTNCPAASLETVSEHALSLYFAARRRTVLLHGLTSKVPSEWKATGSLGKYMRLADGTAPLTCADEVVGIIGYGGSGKRIAALMRALGMKVLIAARKNLASPPSSAADAIPPPTPTPTPNPMASTNPSQEEDATRTPFSTVLRTATVLVLCLPRTPDTLNLISHSELSLLSPHTILINVARGGIVDEAAVVSALKAGTLAGYAADVFEREPIEGPTDTPLLGREAEGLNITLSPHLAWFSGRTEANLGRILGETVGGWAWGKGVNVVA